ncbi:hypothetical protein TRFO_30930 [Tritrichomonas foetus]|uniref:Uncharacterized protein n=1 Tax=Tritrichomonas foetus TaxID=1144522 RepID=A0A1J4JUA3_9EUKA|nr:hypothetical protein TRFO_30930 [Tritrichomonas foetus]|eukprot:OHT02056.1 hypothetical protein TRFO_30930 [Tritrichomonas foetus]
MSFFNRGKVSPEDIRNKLQIEVATCNGKAKTKAGTRVSQIRNIQTRVVQDSTIGVLKNLEGIVVCDLSMQGAEQISNWLKTLISDRENLANPKATLSGDTQDALDQCVAVGKINKQKDLINALQPILKIHPMQSTLTVPHCINVYLGFEQQTVEDMITAVPNLLNELKLSDNKDYVYRVFDDPKYADTIRPLYAPDSLQNPGLQNFSQHISPQMSPQVSQQVPQQDYYPTPGQYPNPGSQDISMNQNPYPTPGPYPQAQDIQFNQPGMNYQSQQLPPYPASNITSQNAPPFVPPQQQPQYGAPPPYPQTQFDTPPQYGAPPYQPPAFPDIPSGAPPPAPTQPPAYPSIPTGNEGVPNDLFQSVSPE